MVLETKMWALGVLVVTGVSFASRPLEAAEQGNLCLYADSYIYIKLDMS